MKFCGERQGAAFRIETRVVDDRDLNQGVEQLADSSASRPDEGLE